MSLYPSLEDMVVGQALQAQEYQQYATNTGVPNSQQSISQYPVHPPATNTAPYPQIGSNTVYPTLSYMGMNITAADLPPSTGQMVAQNQTAIAVSNERCSALAPVTGGANAGVMRSEIKQGVRMVTICRDQSKKFGLKLKSIDAGIFCCFVSADSPAALVGIRFGDQILKIDGQDCAGMSSDKAFKMLTKADDLKCELVIRDRPFERTITLQKDSSGHVGFNYKNGKITHLLKDSSAARNGLLIDHQICEVGGQSVVGMKDKELSELFLTCGRSMTLTIMPISIYEHIIKKVSSGLFKKMDHSIPEC